MATKLFLKSESATTHLGTNAAKLDTATSGWTTQSLSTTAGGTTVGVLTSTVAGTTLGVEIASSGSPIHWVSPPVDADVTISGAITGNLWMSENNMSANVAANFVVDVIRATDTSIVQIVKSARTTEVAVTTRAVNNFTATPGAGVAVNKGDRLRVRVFGDDAGTMASGFTFDLGYGGPTGGADGDTFVSFTETFGFLDDTADPAGTTLYPTDTASDVATASVDREMWTARGGSAANDVTNTAAGWTAPIHVTDTAGGTVVDWFTKQLQAFTLTGLARLNIHALESSNSANASLKAEIARVDSDGTNPTVWATWCLTRVTGGSAELPTTEGARDVWLSGDDLAFTNGQRIRFRIYVDDFDFGPLVTGHTVTTYYNGPTGGASGDTFLILPQTVAEFAAGPATSFPFTHRNVRNVNLRR